MQKRIGIVAMTPAGIIGLDGTLPWHLPADLAFFKRTTSGHPIVMGRKTYDSIGRPLPNRRNIVLTHNTAWSAPGVETIPSPAALGDLSGLDGTIYIIGGSKVYEAFLPTLDELLISHVSKEFPGDTWFPEFQPMFEDAGILEEHPDFTVRRWVRKH
jgi:dihydrofolate reductase